MMAVSPADITVGGLYVRFTEVREVIGVSRYGDVTFLSRSMMDRDRQSVTLDTRSRELFAIEAERQVSAYYRPPRSN
jgi:hypothetical protein